MFRRRKLSTGQMRAFRLLQQLRSFWDGVHVPPEQHHRAAQRRLDKSLGRIEALRTTRKSRAKVPARKITEPLAKRQSRRELAGFYEGTMALAHVLGQRHGRFGRQKDDATGKLVRMR